MIIPCEGNGYPRPFRAKTRIKQPVGPTIRRACLVLYQYVSASGLAAHPHAPPSPARNPTSLKTTAIAVTGIGIEPNTRSPAVPSTVPAAPSAVPVEGRGLG